MGSKTENGATSMNANSFYRYGNETMLSVEKDSRNETYKIKLATPDHYVVSKEFDRTVGLYANAPDEVICTGMMNFSDTLVGAEFSIYDTMSCFIDRVFDNAVFGPYDENAIWLSTDYPTYEDVETIHGEFGFRLMWFPPNHPLSEPMHDFKFKMPNGSGKTDGANTLLRQLGQLGVTAGFIGNDKCIEKFMQTLSFEDMRFSCFKARYGKNGRTTFVPFVCGD